MKKLFAALVAMLALVSPALAQKTKANMTTEINTNYPDNTTQAITPSVMRSTTIDQVNSWQQAPQVRTVAGVTDTLTVADFGNMVIYNNAGGIAVTVAQATGTFASFNVYVKNTGAGAVTITPTTSQINGASTLVLAQNQGAYIISDGTNYQLGPTVFANSVVNSQFAQAPADTTKCNPTGGTANVQDCTLSQLNSFGVAALSIADQTVTGGANVTSLSLSTGNVTIDCGSRPLQFITNGGAFTLTAPANDGSCLVLVTNNASAGAITFSGFSVGTSTGDALTTTNTNKFTINVWRINGTSGYRVAAHQ